MKKLSMLVLAGIVCCLIGCENAELVTCQEDNQTLQAEVDDLQVKLDKANDGIIKKNEKIEKMKADNVEMQTKAMQGIQSMMMKQGERDIQNKNQIKELQTNNEELQKQNKMLQKQIGTLKAELNEAKEAATAAETAAPEEAAEEM
ncbi:MAG: hypothetical protein ACYTET_00825 [Planctomycetota bacterium]|jgi:chromosome segregation ATPase